MRFDFNILDAKLEYTYVPAYEKPDHAWLVPVWVFKVNDVWIKGQYRIFVINALDGGVIGKPMNS